MLADQWGDGDEGEEVEGSGGVPASTKFEVGDLEWVDEEGGGEEYAGGEGCVDQGVGVEEALNRSGREEGRGRGREGRDDKDSSCLEGLALVSLIITLHYTSRISNT